MMQGLKLTQPPLFERTTLPKRSASTVPKYWYRVTEQNVALESALLPLLRERSCCLVHSHLRTEWSAFRDDNRAANSPIAVSPIVEDATRPETNARPQKIYSFHGSTVCVTGALESCTGVEWLLTQDDVSGPIKDLASLRLNLPLDASDARRLKQRTDLLRASVSNGSPVGIGMCIGSLLSNIDIVAQLPIDFVTAIVPSAVLGSDHAGRDVVQENIVEQISKLQRARKAVDRDDIAIVLQAPLRSGYDAAAFLNSGIDAIILNGWNVTEATSARKDDVGAFAASFLGVSTSTSIVSVDTQSLIQKLDQFFAQLHDGFAYAT